MLGHFTQSSSLTDERNVLGSNKFEANHGQL